jgi:haloacetate dehalogenase
MAFFAPEAFAEYLRCFKNPATVRGMCEDYRATFGVDLAMDTADFAAGRRIGCPVLLLWGAAGGVGRNHQPLAIWQDYASNIVGAEALPCGHYVPEECSMATAAALRAFFAA